MGLGGLVGSGLVGIWAASFFPFKGICRYVAMICFGVVPIIVTLLSGPDEFAFTALAAGSAWVMAWASITSVENRFICSAVSAKGTLRKSAGIRLYDAFLCNAYWPIGLRARI